MSTPNENRVELMVDYIMKNCLWQFHSRNWDRERQNAQILGLTTKILCDEPFALDTPEVRCYNADAVMLAKNYQARFDWLNSLSKPEIQELMGMLHERLDYLTITGSLNAELTDERY
jgi:nitrogenase delta subunit